MSAGVAPNFYSENAQQTQSWTPTTPQNGTAPPAYAYPATPVASSSSGSWQLQVQTPVQNVVQKPVYVRKPPKQKKRTAEETEITNATAARVATRLVQDQAAVLNPDVDAPFQDQLDVVKRLLPYHIYQQPKEDLRTIIDKGKGKEIEETKFAIECHKRLERIRQRWRDAKIREGKRASPDDQAYMLAQLVLESERTDTAMLSSELKAARTELERIQKEQRLAANTARMTQFATPATPAASQYYRTYPYTYAQPYGTHATTTTFSATPQPPPPTPPPNPASSYTPYHPGGAIPVQLPVTSLPGLHALGIVPVPTASLPPEGQPQPPAILRGSSSNGTMLNLEINVSLLQSAQMSGLALILNSLVARNAATLSGAANPAPSPMPYSHPS